MLNNILILEFINFIYVVYEMLFNIKTHQQIPVSYEMLF